MELTGTISFLGKVIKIRIGKKYMEKFFLFSRQQRKVVVEDFIYKLSRKNKL